MQEIKKIVCSLDIADVSPQVIEYATMMSQTLKATLLVLYVAPSLGRLYIRKPTR